MRKLNALILIGTFVASLVNSVSATQLTYTENDTSNTNFQALGYPVPIPTSSQTAVDGFRDYDSLFARHQDMALSSPVISGEIIGQTTGGENIWAYVLSDADTVTNEGNILEGSLLQNGGIHAREWQSPEVVTGIIERFFEKQHDQGFYQYLLENSQMILIPVLNVDGFKQTQRYPANAIFSTEQGEGDWPRDGRMRRKNMRAVDIDLTTENDFLLGVDLNRNNNPYWATDPGNSSGRTASIVHHGNGPASEPEIQALQTAADLASGRLRFYTDTHSFTKVYFTPMTGNTRRDNITAIVAGRMRAVNSYAYSPSIAGGGIGATDEYFANTYQIPSYTLETEPGQGGGTEYGGFGVSHDGFILPESEIARVRDELANASILGFYMQAAIPSITQVQISRTDDDSTVYLGQWLANSATTRTWQESINITLQADINYRVRLSFNKTMRWRENNQTVQYPGQSVTLNPSVVLEGVDSSGEGYAITISNASGQWLNSSGNFNDGYQNYKDDSYLFEFTLAENSPALNAQLQQLAITVTDLAGQSLDALPSTVIDWNNGGWSRYEFTDGSLADVGGTDRTVRLINDGSASFTDPMLSNNNNSGSGSGNGSSSSSGGGGSNAWEVILGLIFLCGSIRLFRKIN